jgi:cation transport ATPase
MEYANAWAARERGLSAILHGLSEFVSGRGIEGNPKGQVVLASKSKTFNREERRVDPRSSQRKPNLEQYCGAAAVN